MESFGLSVKDLEADFDPETYDGVMQKMFDEDYYEGKEEEEKPEFSDMEGESVCSHADHTHLVICIIPSQEKTGPNTTKWTLQIQALM